MTCEEAAIRLNNHDNEIGSLKHRMRAVEEDQKALSDLTASVREMAAEQWHLKEDVGEIKADVKSIKDKPAKRWDSMVDKLLFAAAGAFFAWILSGTPGL